MTLSCLRHARPRARFLLILALFAVTAAMQRNETPPSDRSARAHRSYSFRKKLRDLGDQLLSKKMSESVKNVTPSPNGTGNDSDESVTTVSTASDDTLRSTTENGLQNSTDVKHGQDIPISKRPMMKILGTNTLKKRPGLFLGPTLTVNYDELVKINMLKNLGWKLTVKSIAQLEDNKFLSELLEWTKPLMEEKHEMSTVAVWDTPFFLLRMCPQADDSFEFRGERLQCSNETTLTEGVNHIINDKKDNKTADNRIIFQAESECESHLEVLTTILCAHINTHFRPLKYSAELAANGTCSNFAYLGTIGRWISRRCSGPWFGKLKLRTPAYYMWMDSVVTLKIYTVNTKGEFTEHNRTIQIQKIK